MSENGKQWEYNWRFLGRRYRAVETGPGVISYYATEIDSDDAPYTSVEHPLGLTNELVHLALANTNLLARVAELEGKLARVTEAVSNLNRYGGSGPGFGGVCQSADGKYVLLDDVLAAIANLQKPEGEG